MYLYILYLSVKHNIFLGIKWRVKKISLERKGVRLMKNFHRVNRSLFFSCHIQSILVYVILLCHWCNIDNSHVYVLYIYMSSCMVDVTYGRESTAQKIFTTFFSHEEI